MPEYIRFLSCLLEFFFKKLLNWNSYMIIFNKKGIKYIVLAKNVKILITDLKEAYRRESDVL